MCEAGGSYTACFTRWAHGGMSRTGRVQAVSVDAYSQRQRQPRQRRRRRRREQQQHRCHKESGVSMTAIHKEAPGRGRKRPGPPASHVTATQPASPPHCCTCTPQPQVLHMDWLAQVNGSSLTWKPQSTITRLYVAAFTSSKHTGQANDI